MRDALSALWRVGGDEMLIKCPECKQEISDQAPSCPKCGQPMSDDDKARGKRTAQAEKQLESGCLIGCGVLVFAAVVGIMWICAPRDHRPDRSSPLAVKLGAEYVVTGTDLGLMDSPKVYYPDPVEFAQHLVLILLPGDVIVPQGYASLCLKIRVATHDGKAVYVVGYMPFEFISQKCRLKAPRP